MTKVPWQTKGNNTGKHVFKVTKPGQVVSIDQMVSTQQGFVVQLKGKLTNQHYKAATIFVDHFSGLRYIHMMTNLSSNEALKAKLAFEQFATNNHVSIEHYHADNGCFADNAFIAHCTLWQQRLTYCGVNTHFQNGIAERAIRDIMEAGRKQLLHAMARWPTAVNLALWPCVVRYAVDLYNTVPVLSDRTSRLEKLSSTSVGARMRDYHTFACPMFALQNAISAGKHDTKVVTPCTIGGKFWPKPISRTKPVPGS